MVDVVGFDFSGPNKKKMLIENLVTELEKGTFKMLYNSRMQNEMLEFKREITDKNNIIYRKPQGGSDDYVDSLALMVLAAKDYYDYMEEDLEVLETKSKIMSRAYNSVRRAGII